jgi:signal transduction histidine kinase
MSVPEPIAIAPARRLDARRAATAVGGAALLAGPALVLSGATSSAPAVTVGVLGVLIALTLLVPHAVWAVARRPYLLVIAAVLALAVGWVLIGLRRAGLVPDGLVAGSSRPGGMPYPFVLEQYPRYFRVFGDVGWPFRVGRISVLPLLLAVLAAAGGLVLVADAARLRLGIASLTPARRAPWRVLTEAPSRQASIGWRMVPGVLLILLAAFLAIGLADRYVADNAILQALALIAVGGVAAILIGSPLLVGSLMRLDRDKAGRAREEERQRFAAHLHDSVLQTLALVQRQAHDPAAVSRLARRQEHALRAWMAGESELASETLAAALREIVAEVEEEYRMTVELTAIGDRPLDGKGEALVAAAREALRNVGRHAPGAPVYMFCEIGRDRAEVFVRDEGPGFLTDEVASERRGIRDAMVGRMAVSGGRATIDSTPGEGTEVALLLGPHRGGR